MKKSPIIGRIQFYRAIKSTVELELCTIQADLIICSEFNDPVIGLIKATNLQFFFMSVSNRTNCFIPVDRKSITISTNKEISRIKMIMPELLPGKYCLYVKPNGICDFPVVEILPLLSAPFDWNESSLTLTSSEMSLCSYRNFRLPHGSGDFDLQITIDQQILAESTTNQLIIREEYGATLGSHVYDSAVVLLRYLRSVWTSDTSTLRSVLRMDSLPLSDVAAPTRSDVVIELGAGCALVGLWLQRALQNAHCCPEIFVTDLRCQEQLIHRNIKANGATEHCHFQELSWGDWEQAAQLKQRITSVCGCDTVQLVVAADVLYDKAAAKLMFSTYWTLATPGITKLLLAQKVRCNSSDSTGSQQPLVDVKEEKGFATAEIVYQEANVIVWLLC